MSSSLLQGMTGLQAAQSMLDVTGNNLANLNTTGFKAQRTNFADLLYETESQGTTVSSGNASGTDPIQVGFGVQVASIDSNFQQGALTQTGGQTDFALQGNGFFVVNSGSEDLYSRAGAFSIDQNGYLVDPATGYRVQRTGDVGEGNGVGPAFQTTGDDDIQIPMGTGIPGSATTSITLQGNLSASATGPAAQVQTSSTPFTVGGQPATAATPLDSLDDNIKNYVAGDTLLLQGTTAAGAPVNASLLLSANPTPGELPVSPTLGDLINAINANFPGSTASINAAGDLVVTDNAAGPSKATLTISDKSGNTGATAWSNHGFQVTTVGKDGDTATSAIQFYDAQGTAHNLTLTYQKQANNTWNLTASIPSTDGTVLNGTITGITFNDDGSFRTVTGGSTELSFQINGLAAPQNISLSMGTPAGFNGLTQFGSPTSASATSQNGYAAGFLTSLSVGQDGVITGVFTNGQTLPIAQMAIANFSNPQGLTRQGNNYFGLSTASGPAQVGSGDSGGRGSVQQGALESSNVNVAQEFTNLITAQQAFEVNSRTITVSDQILQDLANLIH